MTEFDWLVSEDPGSMLEYLRGKISGRKLRLFACGCSRLSWDGLTDQRSRRAVEVAERYANGRRVGPVDWSPPWRGAWAAARTLLQSGGADSPAYLAAWHAAALLAADPVAAARQQLDPAVRPAAQAALLRCIAGNPWRPVTLPKQTELKKWKDAQARSLPAGLAAMPAMKMYAEKIKELEDSSDPWITPTVVALARAAYDERRQVPCLTCGGTGEGQYNDGGSTWRVCDCGGTGHTTDGLLDPDRLSILADALEEAGCPDGDLLRHLRGWQPCYYCLDNPAIDRGADEWCTYCGRERWLSGDFGTGPHARGCWALDLILGNS
jgi:hypothetical protein